VLICLDPRPEPFPFDIRHRSIINYTLHSTSDFEKLKSEVVKRLKAQVERAEKLQTVAAMSQMSSTEGLSSHEIAALVTIMSQRASPSSGMSVYMLKDEMKRSGYTPIASGLALESLARKEMIEHFEEMDYENRETYPACRLTPKGIDWLLENQNQFRMQDKQEKQAEVVQGRGLPLTDEDIPF
jgi:hypothetical protein